MAVEILRDGPQYFKFLPCGLHSFKWTYPHFKIAYPLLAPLGHFHIGPLGVGLPCPSFLSFCAHCASANNRPLASSGLRGTKGPRRPHIHASIEFGKAPGPFPLPHTFIHASRIVRAPRGTRTPKTQAGKRSSCRPRPPRGSRSV